MALMQLTELAAVDAEPGEDAAKDTKPAKSRKAKAAA
jgi:hypothetical protein